MTFGLFWESVTDFMCLSVTADATLVQQFMTDTKQHPKQ